MRSSTPEPSDNTASNPPLRAPGLALVTCGGTIAMRPDAAGTRRPASSAEVADLVGDLAGCAVTWRSAGEIDSSQATPADWAVILREVRASQAEGPRPVIITHGTDSLAWTAGMLAVAGPWDVPVVLTAANTPLGEPGSDAAVNLEAAVAAANGSQPGVMVAFAGTEDALGQVFQGGFVRKVRAGGAAFAGVPERLGFVAGGQVVFERGLRFVPTCQVESFGQRVAVVRCDPALDVALYGDAVRRGAVDSVVVELYACGTAPASVVELARVCAEREIPISACPVAPLDPEEAAYPSTKELEDAGVAVHLDATIELLVPLAGAGRQPFTRQQRQTR